ncbi:SCF ubiquitin ligase complex subunit cdc4 [Knufia fluminis]|uniref:Probable E3 ubiquitin ligase complex SCF subunit sconB n=1 Tax=Knufia fluminis TaxID=191047 RepID=A0AAN8FGN7_9EURO|nr:SCF ubiquitin ligase complex subunit cdc4 [Knufia fluminis]
MDGTPDTPSTRPKSADLKRKNGSNQSTRRKMLRERVLPESTLGQFSFGPATQTTVVTTTTTTTTKFPPFVMPNPEHANDLDPRIYPLAASPTPAALQNIGFSLGGKAVVFREATDTMAELDQIAEEERQLARKNGTIQTVQRSGSVPPIKKEHVAPSIRSLQEASERPASPESIAELDSQAEQGPAARTRRSGKQRAVHPPARSHPRLRAVRNSNPVTPETRTERTSKQRPQAVSVEGRVARDVLPTPAIEHQQDGPRKAGSSLAIQQGDGDFPVGQHSERRGSRTISRASYDSAVPTPPIEPDDLSLQERRLSPRALSSIPTRLHVSESPSIQDGTLPSPSLSPVTAGASTQHNEYFADIDDRSDFGSQFGHPHGPWSTGDSHYEDSPSHGRYESPAITETALSDDDLSDVGRSHASSVRDIPPMLNFFEALPDAMKSYVMHQLLRRCPKQTLQVVADVVNPVLKCDFLTLLPPELSMNIVRHLDVQSLCRASQVSKKWRQMLNSDERAWKELFDADGYSLPQGELQQAIVQGWGWQDPFGPDAREVNMSQAHSVKSDSEIGSPGPSTSRKPGASTSLRRSKRKAATQLTNRSKMAKRQATSRETSVDLSTGDWMSQLSTAEGPNNAANAAIVAVPNPELPVPTLKGLHLYKSLYRRHHLIKRNWMSEEAKPHHLAFRAHGSHVVTCLQFDTDKILTGSDDSNINVYDTKTGKLRKLLRGHEGGVWALQYIGNTLVSGSTDRSVRIWDIDAGRETHVFRGHTSTVRCLQILQPTKIGEAADGKDIMMPKQPIIITGSRDSTLRIWKLPKPSDSNHIQVEADAEAEDSPYYVRTLTGHQHSVRAIAAHADTLVSGSYDCSVRVWKISTGETVHRLQGHTQKVYSVVLDHARNRCISGSMDYLVKIWSLETGSALYTLEGHSSLVGLLDLNCDRLVSAAADSTLRIWDPENGQCKSTLTAHTGAITCFQHDSQKVISGSDRTLKMWDIKTGYCKKDLLSDLSGVWQVKFNDRRCVAAVQRDSMTFIEVLDFGAARDGIAEKDRGRRIVVDEFGGVIENDDEDGGAIV